MKKENTKAQRDCDKNAQTHSPQNALISEQGFKMTNTQRTPTKTPKLTQRDIAGILQIDTKTLYNWRKHKPQLYAVVMLGFEFKELLKRQKAYTKELEEIEQSLDERLRLP